MRIKRELVPLPSNLDVRPAADRILLHMPVVCETTSNGLILPQESQRLEAMSDMVGYVLAVGPLAFSDTALFSDQLLRSCQPGDWVVIRKNVGDGFVVMNDEGEDVSLRLVHDDAILALTSGPGMVKENGDGC